jgi:hypothetical protein
VPTLGHGARPGAHSKSRRHSAWSRIFRRRRRLHRWNTTGIVLIPGVMC